MLPTYAFVPNIGMTWWLSGSSVDLKFITSQYYDSSAGGSGQAVTSYLSCSRASIGYGKTSSGVLTQFSSDVLRITDLGLLVEDSRQNLLIWSQDFSQDWNAPESTITTDQIAAPDGTTTADKSLVNADGFGKTVSTPSLTGGTAYTVSMYVKLSGSSNTWVQIWLSDGVANVFGATFNLAGSGSAGSNVLGGDGSITAKSVESLADSWYRCIFTGQCTSTHSMSFNFKGPSATDGGAQVATDYSYLWGKQIEAGGFVSSYIPTTTTTATRAADVLTITGNLQTDIAAATGSIVAQINNGEAGSFAANIVDSNGTNLLGFDATNHGLASITATLATTNTANRTTRDKLGIAWNASGRSLVLNGGTVATDATAQTPNSTQHLGSSGSDKCAYAYIERLTDWTSKLADASLQGYTT